jgi:mannobiose 2-epimerase
MTDPEYGSGADAAWKNLPKAAEAEWSSILRYWETRCVDTQYGGFIGRIDGHEKPDWQAPKGSVLYSRILWAFSAAFSTFAEPAYLRLAGRAFQWIRIHFTDKVHGGLFWSVDHRGNPLDSRKQVYAQAFAIYGLSEYFRACGDGEALRLALDIYRLLETHSHDYTKGGYRDAFSNDWGFLPDQRLSAKDENAVKTMNTHLHLVEAFANLYEVWPAPALKEDIVDLLDQFDRFIIDRHSGHLGLFFDADWKKNDSLISYGHDIEAAWLLQRCAESTGDRRAISRAKENAVLITEASMEGLDRDGALWYEFDLKSERIIREKHWWPQAEAVIGFANAWQITGEKRYQKAVLKTWNFISGSLVDPQHGEWYWGVDEHNRPMRREDKAGFWKCPYHNSRACQELMRRLG